MLEEFARQILAMLDKGEIKNKSDLDKAKKELAKKYGLKEIPTNPDIMLSATDEQIEKHAEIAHIKPTRTISGVAIITVSCKPGSCGGACIYCPKGENAPKSYTGFEPAIQRAIRNNYDSYKQVKDRLNQFKIMGHPRDKIEIILLGGTFLVLEKSYRSPFIKGIYDALNDNVSKNLEQAQKINETAKFRCIGLTVETRPDFCKERHIDELLSYGTTRVEIGIQSIDDDILGITKRGHAVKDTVDAMQIARDAGLKIVAHVMPGLPCSSLEKDVNMFKTLFTDHRFIPDDMKIYPTMLMPNTPLYDMWKRGEYKPLTDEETIDILVEAKKLIPPYIRNRRVFRDMPSTLSAAGPKKSNMRELVQERMRQLGLRCRCTRCREIGHRGIKPENIGLVRREYKAGEGNEIFLSFEDVKYDILIALLRLRIPSEKAHRPEINSMPTSIVREIHTYGPLVPIREFSENAWQHKGYGRQLLQEAEKISQEDFDVKKIVATAGVGVKQWFLKQGYNYDGPYVSKFLQV